jgi:pimeloyl-ACP methyl ester carboxylesterase
LGIVLAGCGTQSPSKPVTPSAAPNTTVETSGPTTEPTTAPSESPSPFGTRASLPLDPRNKGTKVVSFESPDGLQLTGRLRGTGSQAVVLAPSGNVRYTQFDWLAAAVKLEKAGYRVLTFNVRGVCYTPDPNVGCSEGDIDWTNAWMDVAGAVEFMRSQPGVEKVSVMGADLGGTEALYAAAQGTRMDGIVTVSGLEESEGYIIGKPILDAVDSPLLFIAGKDDDEAFQAYTDWLRDAKEPKDGLLLPTDMRGTFIFEPLAPFEIPLAKKALTKVVDFFESV